MSAGPIVPFNSWKTFKCFVCGGHRYTKVSYEMLADMMNSWRGSGWVSIIVSRFYPFDQCIKCFFKGDDYGPG